MCGPLPRGPLLPGRPLAGVEVGCWETSRPLLGYLTTSEQPRLWGLKSGFPGGSTPCLC